MTCQFLCHSVGRYTDNGEMVFLLWIHYSHFTSAFPFTSSTHSLAPPPPPKYQYVSHEHRRRASPMCGCVWRTNERLNDWTLNKKTTLRIKELGFLWNFPMAHQSEDDAIFICFASRTPLCVWWFQQSWAARQRCYGMTDNHQNRIVSVPMSFWTRAYNPFTAVPVVDIACGVIFIENTKWSRINNAKIWRHEKLKNMFGECLAKHLMKLRYLGKNDRIQSMLWRHCSSSAVEYHLTFDGQ